MPETFEGRKGPYKILGERGGKYVVQYTGGEWVGKTLPMSKDLHERMQYNLQMEKVAGRSRADMGAGPYLEIWWDKFRSLYKQHHVPGIHDIDMMEILEDNYPDEAKIVDMIWENQNLYGVDYEE